MDIQYLTVKQVLEIHDAVLDPGEPASVRDIRAVEAATAAPQATMFDNDLYRDPITKAAALLRGLCQNHGFVQGNKRTAWVSMRTFLTANGFEIGATSGEAVRLLTRIATHDASMDEVVDFIHAHIVAYPSESQSENEVR